MRDNNPAEEEQEEDYFLPLEDQRVFGAGIRRKRVPFVRSSDGPDLNTTDSALRRHASAPTTAPSSTGATIANTYLSIVLSKSTTPIPEDSTVDSPATAPSTTTTTATAAAAAASPQSPPAPSPPPTTTTPPLEQDSNPNPTSRICEICNLPLTAASSSASSSEPRTPAEHHPRPHEASLAHQLCLTHSHPPSHLDRTRPGLRYLAAYGWDPDSRVGLGAPGREGIVAPVKGKVKVDTVGLGVAGNNSDDEGDPKKRRRGGGKEPRGGGSVKVQKKLNAKEVRRGQVDARKRGERLRELFYQDERVLRYLGDG